MCGGFGWRGTAHACGGEATTLDVRGVRGGGRRPPVGQRPKSRPKREEVDRSPVAARDAARPEPPAEQVQRLSLGTRAITWLTCWPQPDQVVRPQERQRAGLHMVVPLLGWPSVGARGRDQMTTSVPTRVFRPPAGCRRSDPQRAKCTDIPLRRARPLAAHDQAPHDWDRGDPTSGMARTRPSSRRWAAPAGCGSTRAGPRLGSPAARPAQGPPRAVRRPPRRSA